MNFNINKSLFIINKRLSIYYKRLTYPVRTSSGHIGLFKYICSVRIEGVGVGKKKTICETRGSWSLSGYQHLNVSQSSAADQP